MPVAIEIENLIKSFGNVKALKGISYQVNKGEIFGFLGPNGAGKTTTIRCLMDFIRPDVGKMSILGLDAQVETVEIKKRVGYLGPDVHLYNDWTGQQHFDYLNQVRGTSKSLSKLVKDLDFNPKIKAKNLSSGNKQKLGLIMALMHDPDILILDEPTAALDPLLQNKIYSILLSAKERGKTVFLSSHNLAEVEKICDRVAIIRQGGVVAVEGVNDFRQKKIHVISTVFDHIINIDDFLNDKVTLIDKKDNAFSVKVQGDINAFMKKLAKCELVDLEVSHASLEEVFLSYYQK